MEMYNAKEFKKRFLQKKDGFISFLFGWALVTVIFLVVLLFQFLSFSNPAEIKKLKGHGTVQTYGFPYEEVFQATVYSINEKGFTIVESDKEDGYIVAAEGRDFFYNGRIIAVFFASDPLKNRTRVEIVSKFMALPPFKELILPRNLASEVLSDIGKLLESYNEKK
jgi:hypothetical protein